MPDKLNPDTCKKIRVICKEISVAHDLDAEIQEELYGHMEDKLIAYLDGEEALTEEDALILVREHFGNPAVLKGLLQSVHAVAAGVSLARRIAAVLIVTAGLGLAGSLLMRQIIPLLLFNGLLALNFAVQMSVVVFSWCLLRRWQRRLDAGYTAWFLTWSPMYLAGSIALLLALHTLSSLSYHPGPQVPSASTAIRWVITTLTMTHAAFACILWIWWCDRPPRKAWAVCAAAGLWAAWNCLASIPGIVIICTMMQEQNPSNGVLLLWIAGSLGTFFAYAVYAAVGLAAYVIARYMATGMSRWPRAVQ